MLLPADAIPNLAQVLGSGNSAGTQRIRDLPAPGAPTDAARLQDILATIGAATKWGRFSLTGGAPGSSVDLPLALAQGNGLSLAPGNTRVNVGKGAIIAFWNSLLIASGSNGAVVSLQSTTLGVNGQGATIATNSQQFVTQPIAFVSTNENEQVWINYNSAPGTPIFANGFLYVLKWDF